MLWITAGLAIAWSISVVSVCMLECIPIRAAWDPSIHDKKCINILRFYYGSLSSRIVLEFILLIIPVPFVWRLHMNWPHKVALTMTFLLGYLCVFGNFDNSHLLTSYRNPVLSFVRLAYVIQLGPKINKADVTCRYDIYVNLRLC